MKSKNGTISNTIDLVKNLKRAEITHLELSSALKNYKNVNKKIHDLIENKTLIQLQKGFYRISPKLIDTPISNETLAQLIYAPSYLSLEWALSHYACIPERVYLLTSVTLKKNKKVRIESVSFEYHHLTVKKYSVGIQTLKQGNLNLIVASPLKALVDLIYFKHADIGTENFQDIQAYFDEDLRLDIKNFLKQIKRSEILELKSVYIRIPRIKNILNYLLAKVK